MTDNEKVPYIQCLIHTGKKVYKYWLVALAVIGVIIGLYFVVSSAWKQIENGLTAIGTALGYAGSIIISPFINAWSLASSIQWYWWVLAGVTVGPLILVAIYCALKHFYIDMPLFVLVVITISAVIGLLNFLNKLFFSATVFNGGDLIIGICSMMWLIIIIVVSESTTGGTYRDY